MDLQSNKWVRTDDTQWRKQINETTFHLVEVREFPDGYIYVSGIIDLDDYSDAEKSSVITGYYPSMEDFEESYPKEEINGILAECIFEQTPEIELTCFGPLDTEEKAEAEALNYICVQIEAEQTQLEDTER